MWLYRVNRFLGPVLGQGFRLRIRGAVDAIPADGPLLVAANHASHLDPWFIGMVFPRPIRFLIIRGWYERSPGWKAVFRAWGTLPVQNSGHATVEAVCALLAAGEAVGVFPEGQISDDGRMRRFRAGLSLMAARSGAAVVPVGLRGNFETLPKGRRFPRLRQGVTVEVGRPRRFEGAPMTQRPEREPAERFLSDVREEVARLAGQDGAQST